MIHPESIPNQSDFLIIKLYIGYVCKIMLKIYSAVFSVASESICYGIVFVYVYASIQIVDAKFHAKPNIYTPRLLHPLSRPLIVRKVYANTFLFSNLISVH